MTPRKPPPQKNQSTSLTTDELATFREFIATRQILIADTSLQTRTGLSRLLRELGARGENIVLANNYHAAMNGIEAIRPELVICDFHLGDQNGLKLMHHQKRQILEPDDCLFILVTADTSEAAVATAAEEEVDSYILKPFTITAFREHLVRAAMAKLKPDEYRKFIFAAKAELRDNQPAAALKLLQQALRLNPKPALAQYYIGRAYLLEDNPSKAAAAFRKGLAHQPLHYRCLTGLFDLLIREHKPAEAYEVGLRLVETFPPTPQRLEALITLAIQNKLFIDTDPYFRMYLEMDYRTPELSRCMSAALTVTGKYHLEKRQTREAMKNFEAALSVATRGPGVLDRIVSALIEHGQLQLAEQFLKAQPAEFQRNPEFLTVEFLLLNENAVIQQILTAGRKLLKMGVQDPRVYEVLIRRALQAKLKRQAEALVYEAARIWPEEKQRFLGLAD